MMNEYPISHLRNKIYLFLIFLFFLSNCETDRTSTKAPKKKYNSEQKYAPKQDSNPFNILHGKWVETAYLKELIRTKSPFLSQDSIKLFVELQIEVDQNSRDEIKIYGFGIHEGENFMVRYNKNLPKNTFNTDLEDFENPSSYYELRYSISKKDTFLTLIQFRNNDSIIRKIRFDKVNEKIQEAFQYYVNKSLVSGRYFMKDELGENHSIRLTNEGKVLGHPKFKTFEVKTDFVADFVNTFDNICFDIQTENQECFAFEILGDSIMLYEKLTNDDIHFSLGQLKFTLIKSR